MAAIVLLLSYCHRRFRSVQLKLKSNVVNADDSLLRCKLRIILAN